MDAASTRSLGNRTFFTFLVLFAAFGEVGFLALSVEVGKFLAESAGHDSAGLAVTNSILVAAMHAAMIVSGIAEVPRRSTAQGVFLRRARWIVGAYLVMLTAVALPARDWPERITMVWVAFLMVTCAPTAARMATEVRSLWRSPRSA
jgi:hypothetical protein